MIFYALLSNSEIREVRVINPLGVPTTLDGMSVVAAGNGQEGIETTKDVRADEKEHAIN